jgi:drug/metabolite transporter (DMT)-like permease
MNWSSLFLLLPVLFWGVSYIAIKVVLRELEPVEMISARFLLAAPVLYIICKFEGLNVWPVEKRGHLFVAAFLVFLHFWVMATGMKETSASNTAWILTTAPIFVAALAWLHLKEPFPDFRGGAGLAASEGAIQQEPLARIFHGDSGCGRADGQRQPVQSGLDSLAR